MNKYSILIVWFLITACGTKSQSLEVNITTLQNSFKANNEVEFLENFPKNYEDFVSYFGWNESKDAANPLYQDANDYIDYLFKIIEKPEYRVSQEILFNIGINGKYQADAVNYFRKKTADLFSENPALICELLENKNTSEINSYSHFYLDSPQPEKNLPAYLQKIENKCPAIYQAFKEQLKQLQKENVVSEVVSEQNTNKLHEIKDFIPDNYFILDSVSGKINDDSYLDKILILADKSEFENNQARVFLILLQNKEGKYSLELKNENIIPCYKCAGGTGGEDSYSDLMLKGKILSFNQLQIKDQQLIVRNYEFFNTNGTFFLKQITITSSNLFDDKVPSTIEVIKGQDITLKNFDYTSTENKLVQTAIIKDPDGYTNLRKEPHSNSQILEKINSGTQVEVLGTSENWILVKTIRGVKGYVHKSRLE